MAQFGEALNVRVFVKCTLERVCYPHFGLKDAAMILEEFIVEEFAVEEFIVAEFVVDFGWRTRP